MWETAGNSMNVTTVIYFRSNTCYLYQCYPFRKKTQLVEMNKMVTAFPCFNNTYWQKSIQNRGKGKSKKKTVFKYSLLFLYMTISVWVQFQDRQSIRWNLETCIYHYIPRQNAACFLICIHIPMYVYTIYTNMLHPGQIQ